MEEKPVINSFSDFWPYYLNQHSSLWNRRIHLVGTISAIFFFIFFLLQENYKALLFIPLIGYGPAWFGHFFVEKNKPATFGHPIYALRGDFYMVYLILLRKI